MRSRRALARAAATRASDIFERESETHRVEEWSRIENIFERITADKKFFTTVFGVSLASDVLQAYMWT